MKRILTGCILSLIVVFFAGNLYAADTMTMKEKRDCFRQCMDELRGSEGMTSLEIRQECMEEARLTRALIKEDRDCERQARQQSRADYQTCMEELRKDRKDLERADIQVRRDECMTILKGE